MVAALFENRTEHRRLRLAVKVHVEQQDIGEGRCEGAEPVLIGDRGDQSDFKLMQAEVGLVEAGYSAVADRKAG